MAEVHVVGQISGASDYPKKRLFCVWEVIAGGGWTLIAGDKDGQTQVDLPEMDDFALWSHPIDVHFATKGVQGWPKISVQVWHVDDYQRLEILGYGYCNVPTSPGDHVLSAMTWRPVGTSRDRILSHFLGGGPILRNLDVIYEGVDRHRLFTESMGKVHFELGVILRGFDKFGVDT